MAFFSYLLEHNRYLNIVGLFVILLIAWLFSKKRSKINMRLVATALAVQFVTAYIVLKTTIGQAIVSWVASMVRGLYVCADYGVSFVFGALADNTQSWGTIFAVKVLPVIIFFGALMSLLFHFGIIQFFVLIISKILRPILGTSGAETLCAIANSFLGQTEAPLLVRNYLEDMTQSEFLLVMVSGMATISGVLLAIFASFGVPITHLLSSSVMAIPASILISKILLPETEKAKTASGASIKCENQTSNMFDAIFVGTTDGMKLALNVGAMLISFLALLFMFNYILGFSSDMMNVFFAHMGVGFRLPDLSLNYIFSYLFAPFGYFLGFTGNEALQAGNLLGTKVALNEFIAYGNLVEMNLSARTTSIMTYALCGFSNFSCIGIQIGGISALVPSKRQWLTKFGLYAVLGGALANLSSAMIASLLL